jgi:flagellar biosynthesis/type III secretory pathway M-ring protein FliF/YscJ
MLKPQTLARTLCLASIVSLLWFLYWIGYDIVVWNKPLSEVSLFNCVGVILSLAIIFAGSRLGTVKNRVDMPEKRENEEHTNVEEQGNEEEKPLPVLQELKKEENSLTEEKQDSVVALKERLQLERKEEIEIEMRRSIQALKDEIAELQHQSEEFRALLKTPE